MSIIFLRFCRCRRHVRRAGALGDYATFWLLFVQKSVACCVVHLPSSKVFRLFASPIVFCIYIINYEPWRFQRKSPLKKSKFIAALWANLFGGILAALALLPCESSFANRASVVFYSRTVFCKKVLCLFEKIQKNPVFPWPCVLLFWQKPIDKNHVQDYWQPVQRP